MNARTIAQGKSAPISPRFDRKFIEDHKLVERYLENKLPFKGARDLEQWCRQHPDYLNELKISERAHASLKLLEKWQHSFPLKTFVTHRFKVADADAAMAQAMKIALDVARELGVGKHVVTILPDSRSLGMNT